MKGNAIAPWLGVLELSMRSTENLGRVQLIAKQLIFKSRIASFCDVLSTPVLQDFQKQDRSIPSKSNSVADFQRPNLNPVDGSK